MKNLIIYKKGERIYPSSVSRRNNTIEELIDDLKLINWTDDLGINHTIELINACELEQVKYRLINLFQMIVFGSVGTEDFDLMMEDENDRTYIIEKVKHGEISTMLKNMKVDIMAASYDITFYEKRVSGTIGTPLFDGALKEYQSARKIGDIFDSYHEYIEHKDDLL